MFTRSIRTARSPAKEMMIWKGVIPMMEISPLGDGFWAEERRGVKNMGRKINLVFVNGGMKFLRNRNIILLTLIIWNLSH